MAHLRSKWAARYSYLIRSAQTKKIKMLKAKHPEIADAIDLFAKEDPSGKYKYISWEIRQALSGEPVKETVSLINTFHENIGRMKQKDIHSYKTLGDLRGAVEQSLSVETRSEYKDKIKAQTQFLYDDGRFIVLFPETEKASCFFGKGTQWCVSATQSENYFFDYARTGVFLYFIIDRKAESSATMSKVAYAISKNHPEDVFRPSMAEVFDSLDRSINSGVAEEYFGEAAPAIIQAMATHFNAHSETPVQAEVTKIMSMNDPKEIEAILNEKPHEEVRKLIAKNPITPSQTIDKLVYDNSLEVAIPAVKHRNATKENLKKRFLSLKGSGFRTSRLKTEIGERILKYANVTEADIMPLFDWELAKLPDGKAESRILTLFGDYSIATFEKLLMAQVAPPARWQMKKANAIVRVLALESANPVFLDMIARNEIAQNDYALLKDLIENVNTESKTLEYLFEIVKGRPRGTLLWHNILDHPRAPPKMLREYAQNDSADIRKLVARNTSTPLEILIYLGGDPDAGVAMAAKKNPSYWVQDKAKIMGPGRTYYEEDADIPLSMQGLEPENVISREEEE